MIVVKYIAKWIWNTVTEHKRNITHKSTKKNDLIRNNIEEKIKKIYFLGGYVIL